MKLHQILLAVFAAILLTDCAPPYGYGGGCGYGGYQRVVVPNIGIGYPLGYGFYPPPPMIGAPPVRRQPSPIIRYSNGMIGGGYSAGFNPATGGYAY